MKKKKQSWFSVLTLVLYSFLRPKKSLLLQNLSRKLFKTSEQRFNTE